MPTQSDASILAELKNSEAELIELLQTVNEDDANFKPAPEKWNILEIIEHINITDKSSYISMLRPSDPPSAEELAEKEIRFNKLANTENLSLVAPSSAEPKGKFKNLQEALDHFKATRQKLYEFASQNDLNSLAIGFEHPRLGFLTRSQWLRFDTWHARHHAKQVRRNLEFRV